MIYFLITLTIFFSLSFAQNQWRNPIPFKIHNNITYKDDIMMAIDYYHEITNVKFIERTNENDYIEFANINGCFSPIGKQGGQQTISIADDCDIGTVIHEIAHSIGIFHEQSRIDRDKYVNINFQNIEQDKVNNFNPTNQQEDLFYDFNSIMHYGQWDFSKNGQKTIDLKIQTNACYIGQKNRLSRYDVLYINDLIGIPGEPKFINNINSIYLCGGRNFPTYSWIFSEYQNINGEFYQSKWPFQGDYKFIKFNLISEKWELKYKNIVYATTTTLNSSWFFRNKNNNDNFEKDDSSYLGNLNEDNYIEEEPNYNLIILIGLGLLIIIFFFVCCFCGPLSCFC